MNIIQYNKFKQQDEYVSGSIKLTNIKNKGRGYISTCNIKPYTILMIAKCICLVDKQNNHKNQTDQQIILYLEKQVENNIQSENFSQQTKKKYKQLFYGNDQQNNNVMGRFNFNSYRLYPELDQHYNTEDKDYLKLGLFPLVGYFNHSCIPNCTQFFENNKAIVISNRQIEQGEELCLSYISKENAYRFSYMTRQQYLQSYQFVCNCELCQHQKNNQKNYETYEDYIQDIKDNPLTIYKYETELIQDYLNKNQNTYEIQKQTFDEFIQLRTNENTLLNDAQSYINIFDKLDKEYIAKQVDQIQFGKTDHIYIRYNINQIQIEQ